MRIKSIHRVSIWISDVDGSNFLEVGHMKRSIDPQHPELKHRIVPNQWLPTGKKMSYVYNESLYTV